MDKLSDLDLSWLRGHISALKVSAYPEMVETYADVIRVIDELRERRKAEHGVVKFKWQCRCGFVNIWSWGMVEYVKWVPTSMEGPYRKRPFDVLECDKCHAETMMHERPEVIHGQD